MIDVEKILKENGWYKYYQYWKHDDYQSELSLFDISDALLTLARKKGFDNVNKFIKHLENEI